jgi:hypothetical protein
MYKIIDLQLGGREFADGALFKNKEEVRQQLISYHETDMEENDKKLLSKMSCNEILDFGQWELEVI